ncbi:hypothetical protein Tco_0991000 [Tanacetum coccineum]|uniref:Uncharacterized protein n=1 Tax=Tanacetum coccineum TaxID=301880 RepID=A0ABQ5EY38_9ASTR
MGSQSTSKNLSSTLKNLWSTLASASSFQPPSPSHDVSNQTPVVNTNKTVEVTPEVNTNQTTEVTLEVTRNVAAEPPTRRGKKRARTEPPQLSIFVKHMGRSERIAKMQAKNFKFDAQGSGTTPDKAFDVSP